jgi:hypothetical protein
MINKLSKIKFNLRSFTSFSLVISTIIMSWSGFILYVAPPGRIANWGTWKLMLFTKSEWQSLHTIFSYLFFILVIVHLFFVNWKTFLTYFRSKIKAGLNRKWELLSALAVTIFIFAGTLGNWTPFGPVMTFGEKVKGSWEGNFSSPPILHMELYTLEKLAIEFDTIQTENLIKTLTDGDIKVSGTDLTLKDIANRNNTTPAAIYAILAAKYKKPKGLTESEVPQGIGKYTVKSTAERSGKNIEILKQILKSKGIEANGETSLRSIADKLGVTPREVYNMLIEK